MNKLLSAATIALPLIAGTGAAMAAPAAMHTGPVAPAHSLVQKAGFVVVPTCGVGVIGYDYWGRPVFGPVCD